VPALVVPLLKGRGLDLDVLGGSHTLPGQCSHAGAGRHAGVCTDADAPGVDGVTIDEADSLPASFEFRPKPPFAAVVGTGVRRW
jgi:hypothetical protein